MGWVSSIGSPSVGGVQNVDPIIAASHLRLVGPQWQGAGTESVRSLAAEFPFDVAGRGYSVGTKVLQAVLAQHDGPTAVVPVEMGDIRLEERDGIEAKAVVLQQPVQPGSSRSSQACPPVRRPVRFRCDD
jgi:hypothetical protein